MEFKITYVAPLLKENFPTGFILGQKKETTLKHKYRFRLLDGDMNVYFKGLASRRDSFDPLDFFGIEYGCTDLQFFESGKYISI